MLEGFCKHNQPLCYYTFSSLFCKCCGIVFTCANGIIKNKQFICENCRKDE